MRLQATRLTAIAHAARQRFNPASMFSAGEQGAWYDPSDMSTMFQDSAGTTPVTAVGQPVGLILDKSKGLVLGAELVTSYDFTTAQWTKTGAVTSTTANSFTTNNVGGIIKSVYTAKPSVVKISGTTTVGLIIRASGSTAGQVAVGPGAFSITFNSIVTFADGSMYFQLSAAGTVTIDNISVRELPGNHAFQTTTTKRPLYQVAGRYSYLSFDGIDDALVTNSIDFTATDKMTVWAGVRKLNTVAAFNSLVEIGATGANGFGIFAPDSNNSNYSFWLKGNSRPTATTYVSPITNVIDVQYDCSLSIALQAKARINGASVFTSNAGLAASGPFANEAMYIGSRSGTSLPFNGNLYSLVGRGAQSSDAQIASTEPYVNGKTGAYGA